MVNKFNFIKGGADRYFLALSDLLERHGHQVLKFCMQHPDNLPSREQKYFVSHTDFKARDLGTGLRLASRVLYSQEAARRFEALIQAEKPDIIHIHNIYHQISPSILPVAKKYGIPVVYHLHDYKLLSPNYKFFSHGQIDNIGLKGDYWRCVTTKCFKDSYLASLLVTLEMYWHHRVLKIYQKNIDYFISPSNFMRQKMIAGGWPGENIAVVPPFVDTSHQKPYYTPGDYLLFFGRLDSEKGVDILLEAMAKVNNPIPLMIVGSGPEHQKLVELTDRLGLHHLVHFQGPKKGKELTKLIAGAYLVVVPSCWYEVFGLVALEAAALGKTVLAANIGGLPELINSRHNGLLYTYNSANDLATKLQWSLANPATIKDFGQAARQTAEHYYTPKVHYQAIMKIYRLLVK